MKSSQVVAACACLIVATACASLLGGCSAASTGGNGSGGASMSATGGRGPTGTGGSSATGGNVGSGGAASGGAAGTGGSSSGGAVGTGGGVVGTGGGSAGRGAAGTGGGVPVGSGGAGGTGTSGFTCPAGPFPAPALAGLMPTRITAAPPRDAFNNNRNNFSIVEGPVWMGDALYISEIGSGNSPPPSRILKVTTAGVVSIAVENAGTNGLALDGAGNLVGGSHKDGAINRFALPGSTTTPVISTYNGQRFNSPNDLTFRTDPDYQAPSMRPQTRSRVYRVAPGASVATVVDESRSQPNGVTLAPDGNTLYVTGSDGLFRYPVASDGAVGAGVKIVQSIGGGDGMAIDCAGNLYVSTNDTLVVVGPTGTALGTINVPGVQSVTNAAFGGADHKTLYITALGSGTQSGLFSVTLNVPGYPY